MNFTLHCGHYHPGLESALAQTLLEAARMRADPLREQILVVAPTGGLRSRLLEVVAGRNTASLYGVQVVSINPLCMQIASGIAPARIVSDSLYFASLIHKIAAQEDLLRPLNFRICRAVYQTLRDLQDGSVTPELLQEVLEAAESDPELDTRIHSSWLRPLALLSRRMEEILDEHGIMNLPLATRIAAEAAANHARSRNLASLFVYGFYDSTEAQFAVLENLAHGVIANGGSAHAYFPFPVQSNQVEHPFGYSQGFFDRLFSLTASLGGEVRHLPRSSDGAGAGVECTLFTTGSETTGNVLRAPERRAGNPEQLDLFTAHAPPQPRIEILSAAGAYDEAWAVAKRILNLILQKNVAFDQVLIVTRSGGQEMGPLLHVLRENRIPCNLERDSTLACNPFSKFAVLVLEARETALAPSILMELMSSPFFPQSHENDFRKLAELMENLLIRSWEDWDRLIPLVQAGKLPPFYEFLEDEEPENVDALRDMARRMLEVKKNLLEIPERASMPAFASGLVRTLSAWKGTDAESGAVLELLDRIKGYPELDDPEMSLAGFIDVFRMYLQETAWDSNDDEDSGAPDVAVTVADIMQARGISADYVFVMGLNRDAFPRRTQEDPFLPDSARRVLREVTGAGPAEKRPRTLLPLKEGTDEELLLFALALRAAQKELVLSFRRADETGRKSAISNYLDEVLRLLTGRTSENNDRVVPIPRHHASKFTQELLPTMNECASLPALFLPEDVIELQGVFAGYAEGMREFGSRLNHTELEVSREVDGIVESVAELWKREAPSVTLSYSRLKNYMQCPFQFFAKNVLLLQESPRDVADEEHDLDPRMKGRMAEDVVKVAIQNLRKKTTSLEDAVDRAAGHIRSRYAPLLPMVLLDVYMGPFREGALRLLRYLERKGYDLAATETPQYEDMIQAQLLPASAGGMPEILLRGIPDLLLRGRQRMIGEMKWGTRPVSRATGYVFGAGEAQFCVYPELVKANQGEELPFRYFRLDVFASHGDPDEMLQRIKGFSVPGGIVKENAIRFFGTQVEFLQAAEFLEQVKLKAGQLRAGNFRILKEPTLHFPPCKYCNFTQLCRRSHTETLLRAKRAEQA